ncbi:hypothetical protein [Alicyclobacillus macrosporangiidus]|uniref:Uncharacterized protein n=1 Tax=Alicyclobacillus macrosporangiidus TaxID=392015 RepID=A0A1I7L0M0_9BACL|nr:hypothetical protein [Alicyclobacillus macrosporangiidus]SFV03076.1 hypothetical protein SAMN05421543_12222 [Alicyclobacillus macrosporangiidus]
MSNTREHHTTVSELGFTVMTEDLPILNVYRGDWVLTGEGDPPPNYWVVTLDGKGIPYTGHASPQELLALAKREGLPYAYAAPYGRYVEGRDDKIQLHEWIRDHRKKMRPM